MIPLFHWLSSCCHRLYYQHKPERLSACLLTVHALLHIAWYIQVIGLVWASWAFPMEWHCNILLQCIKSHCHPYECISNFQVASTQLLKKCSLILKRRRQRFSTTVVSSVLYNLLLVLTTSEDPFALLAPHEVTLDRTMHIKIHSALSMWLGVAKWVVASVINLNLPVVQYGRVTCLDGGDIMTAWDIIHKYEDTWDASYVKVFLQACYLCPVLKLTYQFTSMYKTSTNMLINTTAHQNSSPRHFLVSSSVSLSSNCLQISN